MKKSASILDYSYPFLDPAVWGPEQKLYSYHKDFIFRLLNSMYENYQLKQPEVWITDIRIIGSLTTSKWLLTSDMDVHMIVDLAKFIEINMPGTDPKIAFDYLDSTRKQFDRAKILAPMTQHPVEYYFEVPEMVNTNTSMVGIYSISQDKWLKDPVIFSADVDFEESKKQVMTEAESIAQALDGSFGKIDRQIGRIEELERMIGAWDDSKKQLFYNKIEEKLKTIEAEILKDLELRQALIDARHTAQDPMADIEIKFKWLQRFGFFGILTNLKNLMTESGGQVTVQELPLLKKIVTDSALKEAFLKEALVKETETDICVDLDMTIAKAAKHPKIGEPIEGAKEGLQKLKDMGYNVIIYSCRTDEDGGLEAVREYLDKHDLPYDSIFEGEKPFAKFYIDDHAIKFDNWDNVVKQVEKSEKKASLGITATLSQKYWIDPSGKEYPVDHYEGHYGWVLKNILKGNMKNYPSGPDAKVTNKADEMIQSGWTRVTTESDYDFAVEVADINHVPSYLDNFIAQHYTGGGIEIDDLAGEYQDIQDPFPSIQKQINKARRARLQPVAKAFSKRDITAQTKKVKQGDYSCVMALVPHDLAQEIVEWGVRNVPDEELYLSDDGKLGRELEAHVTIKYGLLTNNGKKVRQSFNEDKPYKAKLGKVKHFQPPELPFDVLTVQIISEDLEKVNKRVTEQFECATDLPSDEYKPHVTIAYMKRGKAHDHVGYDGFEGKEVELDTVVFSPHKGNRTYFSVSHDKESQFVLEKIEKFADADMGYWIDPQGNIYDSHGEGLIHAEWIAANLNLLQKQYHINIPDVKEVQNQADEYFHEISEGHDNIELPDIGEIWHQMLQQGWVRVGDADDGIGVEVLNLRKIPAFLEPILAADLTYEQNVMIEDINHNSVVVEWPWKNLQRAVNKELMGGSGKQASIEQVETPEGNRIPVLVNPSSDELLSLQNRAGAHSLRGLVDPNTGDLYAWEAYKSIHTSMIFALGLDMDYNKYSGLASKYILHYSGDSVLRMLDYQNEVRRELNTVRAASQKTSEFLPSLATDAPDNDWQFAQGGDDKEIPVDPDAVSDETTDYAPCTTGKPRKKEVWRQFISMFSNLFSKNDTHKIEAATEEELVQIGLFNAGKYGKFPIEVPQDLLDKYFSSVIYFKQLMRQGPNKVKELDKLDRERKIIHDQLMTFAFNRIAGSDKKPQDFPMAAGDMRYQISEFIEAMVPREDLSKDSAYNPALEEIEKNELGEDQTAHEYSKDFTDLNLKKTPHNTTWDSLVQDGEPSKPTSVTYSPQISNDDNLDQNSPGGYPRRFMGKPKGEYSSTEGEVTDALVQMLRNRTAVIESTTTDITKEAFLAHAYWIDPEGKVFEVRDSENTDSTHWNWINEHEQMLKKDYGIRGAPYINTDTLVSNGWTRIGDGSDADQWQVQLQSIKNIPSVVDNTLAQFVPEGATIEFTDNENQFVMVEYPFKSAQAAVNRALRMQQQHVPMAASLKTAVTKQYALYVNNTGYPAVRTITYDEALQFVKQRFPEAFAKGLYKIQEERMKVSSLNKDAGSQSASVPDYLCDEWKTEQINNDTDEEPYVNHDQRDYPYGMHDSPENTGTGIGWPKDNSRAVVRLDTLENPAFRLDPFGIGEYNVTYYTAMPMSDGIEQMNEE